jgi:hypothetical protein
MCSSGADSGMCSSGADSGMCSSGADSGVCSSGAHTDQLMSALTGMPERPRVAPRQWPRRVVHVRDCLEMTCCHHSLRDQPHHMNSARGGASPRPPGFLVWFGQRHRQTRAGWQDNRQCGSWCRCVITRTVALTHTLAVKFTAADRDRANWARAHA